MSQKLMRPSTVVRIQKQLRRAWQIPVWLMSVIVSREFFVEQFFPILTTDPQVHYLMITLIYTWLVVLGFYLFRQLAGELQSQKQSDLDNLQLKIERANRLQEVGLMTAGIAHNFRNYINILEQSARMLEVIEQTNSQASRALRIQGSCILQAKGVIDQMLAFAKSDAKTNARMRPVHEIIEDAVVLSEVLTKEHRVTIVTDIKAKGACLELNDISLMQSIINLVKNSAEASKPGDRIVISTSIEEIPGSLVPRYSIIVKDEGRGMSEHQIKRLFDPFGTTKGFGTGLGLVTVKKLVESEGGSVTVKAKEGEGTEVKMSFPSSLKCGEAALDRQPQRDLHSEIT